MKNYTLPKEFGERFLTALRSGEYKQGKTQLRDETGYCCLGVACAMEGYDTFCNEQWIGGKSETLSLMDYPQTIPDQLVGLGGDNQFAYQLARLNDTDKTFPEIADWIESNVEFI